MRGYADTDSDSDSADGRMRAPSIGAGAVMGEVRRLSGAVAKEARKLTGTHGKDIDGDDYDDDDDDKYGIEDGSAVACSKPMAALLLLGVAITLCMVGASGGTHKHKQPQ